MKTLAAYLLLGALATTACAQPDYPTRPIKIVVPFQAGAAADSYARFIGQRMSDVLKQPVVIENKPGASGLIGADYAAKAAPDGYTLGYIGIQHAASKYLVRSATFDMNRDMRPLQMAGVLTQVVVVAADNPAKTLAELAQAARKRGDEVNFGSGGNGSPAHLAAVALADAGGFKATHIPYKGSPESITALIGGQVDYLVTTASTALPLVKAQRIRALAVTSAQSLSQFPGVPTVEQALPPGFVFQGWNVLMAPAKTPQAVVEKLSNTLTAIMHEPATAKFFAESASSAETLPPDPLAAYLRSEDLKMEKLIRKAGLQPE